MSADDVSHNRNGSRVTLDNLTHKQRAEFAIQAAQSFVERALYAAQMVASAAQSGQVKVVEQYLANLESLRVEADRWEG